MFNKIVLVGNLTRDLELRYIPSGSAICSTAIATSRKFKKQDGTMSDDTCFIDITFFGRTAEVANQYLKKGSKILVEGRLKFDQWSDQNGNKRSKHSVVVESMVMLDSKNNSNDFSGNSQNQYQNNNDFNTNAQSYQKPKFPNQQEQHNTNDGLGQKSTQEVIPDYDVNDDEIPF